ncbi:YL1 nuclear protein-domain-containing protein [Apodospora peruviana]|uniref:YL1 nuclear protein-domain-containing protein n=1 Tax=Apodospora peruviana TaxID=516989 RepID=A0AAE0ICZ7_9PEZI|nr:YL1 nuclear protein-domain-containing protein [Apodospora peruviana]
MATNEDESNVSRRGDELSDTGSTSDSDSDASSDTGEPEKIEWLATARAKRSTAGNRMKSMLANEEPAADDSDLELLFAEDEEDAGFTDIEDDASDVRMDSSSDEEDQDDGVDDLEGEKELERQAKAKKLAQRKRKAQEAIPVKFRKKVRIEQPVADSASVSSAAPRHQPRPKKKSERSSWLPAPSDLPTRASLRQTTQENKQQLHQKMVEDEIRRKKQQKMLEKKGKKQEAPPMTQAERLAEAALVEKRNSKSLNRWEVAEKQREEERLKKIAALNNRKLDGPVVTFWSGIQQLEEGQLKHVGNLVSIEEKAPRKKRQSLAALAAAQEAEKAKTPEASKPPSPTEKPETKPADPVPTPTAPDGKPKVSEPPTVDPVVQPPPPQDPPPNPSVEQQPTANSAAAPNPPLESTMTPSQGLMAPPQDEKQLHSAVLAAPVLTPPTGVNPPLLGGHMSMMGFSASNGKSNVLALPNTSQGPSQPSRPQPVLDTNTSSAPEQAAKASATNTTPLTPSPTTPLQPTQGKPRSKSKASAKVSDIPQQENNPEPPREGKVTRSCIILQNFDEDAIKDRQVQTQILFGRKMNKLAKPAHAALCVITNHPARYRDPKTGLPYYNSYAFREIQRVHRGDYKWSRLIGAYMGSGNYAARSVPERFLDPTKKRSTPVTIEKAVPAEAEAGKGPETAVLTPPEGDVSVVGVKVEGKEGQVPNPEQGKQPLPSPATVVKYRLEPTFAAVPTPVPAPVVIPADRVAAKTPGPTFAPIPAPAPAPAPIPSSASAPHSIPDSMPAPSSAPDPTSGSVGRSQIPGVPVASGGVFAPLLEPAQLGNV